MHTDKYDEIIGLKVGDAEYPPDASQQEVIKSINNTVVSAGAGSGKTEVLATRFAYLLMTDPELHVRNILAITFTKKAASEIYARVFKKLNDFKNTLSEAQFEGKYKSPDDAKIKDKPVDLAKRALAEFSDARIQTLDSYSNDVVKLAVARYGIKPDYSVGEPSSDINYMAKNFILKNLEKPEFADAYKVYSKVGRLEEFAKTYFAEPVLNYTSIATKEDYFSNNLKTQTKEIIFAWNEIFWEDDGENNFENLCPAKCHRLIGFFYNQLKDSKNGEYGTQQFSPYFKSCLKAINAGDEVDFSNLMISESEFSDADAIAEKLTPFINWISLVNQIKGKGSKADLKDVIKNLKPDATDPLNLYDKLTACYSFIKNYNATAQMYRLMDMFTEEVNSKKKRDGILSFKDISELALRVLREQNDIREQQRSLIKKIMIDEFQDNNDNNRKLLFLISGKNSTTTAEECEDGNHLDETKLFFVGDEKQSIYKFRGADVSVFNGLKDSLKGFEGEQVLYSMNNNYRSDKELLKAFNEMFGDDKKREPDSSQRPEKDPKQFYAMPSLFYFEPTDYFDPKTGKSKIPEYEAMYLKEYTDKNGNKKSNYATKPGENGDEVEPINLAETNDGKTYKNIKIHACILNSGKNRPENAQNKNANASQSEANDEKKFSDEKKANNILSTNETAAFFIAKKIRRMVDESKEAAKQDKNKKPLSYSDFAILDSSRTHRGDLQKFLTMENIPFSVDVQKNIFAEGILNDFYNFLRICIYPNDTNSFISFLVSPFVCISQNGAQNIMSVIFDKNAKEKITDSDGNEITINKNFEAFSDEFNSSVFGLSDSDKRKYDCAKEFYKNERAKILSSSITKTVEHLWYDTGYFYETELNENTKIYAEQFDLLYQIAIQAENQGKNIEWFIDQLAITKEAEKALIQTEDSELTTDDVHYPLEKQDAVTIMTIHQSKGLEFENVFVTGIFNNPKAEISSQIYFEETIPLEYKNSNHEPTFVSIRPNDGSSNYFFLRNKEESKNKSLAEQKRLIYVAITRAKHEVFIVGDLEESDTLNKMGKDQNPSLMNKILRQYYYSDKGLCQNNDYSEEKLSQMCGCVPAEEPYYNATDNAPFDFIKINPVSSKARTATQKSVKEQKLELRTKFGNMFYENYGDCKNLSKPTAELQPRKPVSQMEKPLQKLSSPSALEYCEHQEIPETSPLAERIAEINEKGANPAYAELNSFFTMMQTDLPNEQKNKQIGESTDGVEIEEKIIEESAAKSEFNRSTFGTMAHAYLEHWAKTGSTENTENPVTFDSQVAKSLSENFDEERHSTISKTCKTMAKNFANSALGKLVIDAKTHDRICKAENSFKMNFSGTLFTGSIDLFFENADGTLTLVDYKTDEYIHPEKYFEQQACYKNAVEKIYGIKVGKCYLYYLRFDKELEITEEVENTEL